MFTPSDFVRGGAAIRLQLMPITPPPGRRRPPGACHAVAAVTAACGGRVGGPVHVRLGKCSLSFGPVTEVCWGQVKPKRTQVHASKRIDSM